MDNDFLSISQMANLFKISRQTLIYYDKIGLFSPVLKNENGYRIYKFDQTLHLASIINMKQQGISLEEIKKMRDDLEPSSYISKMKERSAIIDEQINSLSDIQDIIKNKIDYVIKNNPSERNTLISETFYKDRYYLPIGKESVLYKYKDFYLNPTLVIYNLKGTAREFGAYLYKMKYTRMVAYKNVVKIPEGTYACTYHFGRYDNIMETVKLIREKYNSKLDNRSIHFNIIDQFSEKDANKFITEINIKIL